MEYFKQNKNGQGISPLPATTDPEGSLSVGVRPAGAVHPMIEPALPVVGRHAGFGVPIVTIAGRRVHWRLLDYHETTKATQEAWTLPCRWHRRHPLLGVVAYILYDAAVVDSHVAREVADRSNAWIRVVRIGRLGACAQEQPKRKNQKLLHDALLGVRFRADDR
ncbi:hypothetical protein A3D62_01945 [Candidatus Kaiserbacteria bacterium RIFCSPHIGHO2_02_FULL_49_11]|uniref:Uncharacterized protein n=1 Tax=Candidatus Kaiserbacteria bacterium RIFCSPHIGHO2_02_FULL_49_11 TaxID=1798489 RepID=A0A1F6CZE5_9BACT|nr:MAG: hypothetical protein A3D62_01945 [Candidatus Kaiserbacteria bacterium RIFCSPHIGHO2_02_FULL_49_11]